MILTTTETINGKEIGFLFTIIGLEQGTSYSYTVIAKNSANESIDTQKGTFTTLGVAEAIIQVSSDPLQKNNKFIRNGQLIIQRGNELFNAHGARVK